MARAAQKNKRTDKEKLYFDAYYDYCDNAMGDEYRPRHPSGTNQKTDERLLKRNAKGYYAAEEKFKVL